MGFLELFVAASMPVLKLLLVTAVGSFLATDYINILGEDARKHINNVVFYVFNPALVSTNLSRTVTWGSVKLLWFMPVNILITFIIGSVLGWIVIQITRPPRRLRGLILGCCSAGNLGNLLLVIVPAVCKEEGSPFGDPDVCHKYALAYASLSMAVGAIYIWSYVYNIVRISMDMENKIPLDCNINEVNFLHEQEILIPSGCNEGRIQLPFGDETAGHLVRSDDSPSRKKVSISHKVKQFWSTLSEVVEIKRLFAPSTCGVIAGFTIGVIPQIRKAFIGENAPLHVIQDSASLVGDGAIPSLTLVMGGNLTKGLHESGVRSSLILGVLLIRYAILPLLGIVIVKGAVRLGFVHLDPLYQFVLLLQYTLPPAMNIGTITQLFGAGESECAVIFLWTYAFASASLTLWSTFFMWLVSS